MILAPFIVLGCMYTMYTYVYIIINVKKMFTVYKALFYILTYTYAFIVSGVGLGHRLTPRQ